ncbi:MAG: hypothetical protein ACW98Y_09140 [Candidatus Thorarchaeota archaeon]
MQFALLIDAASMEVLDSIKSSCSTYSIEENEVSTMRNLLGGAIGALVGTSLVCYLAALSPNVYPDLFGIIWFLLDGARFLESTLEVILTNGQVIEVLTVWLLIGIFISPFSKTEANTVRTVIWLGVILGSFSVASVLLMDPTFWGSQERNVSLLVLYIRIIITSLLPLFSAIPLVWLGKKLRKNKEVVAPDKIETTCLCGAVFKSKPMICAECGRTLVESTTLSTDSSA